MERRLIVHQFDPFSSQAGGVDTCISDLIAYAPAEASFDVIGVTSDQARIGRWQEVEHRGRQIRFFGAALNVATRNTPVSARIAAGLARWRPRSPGVVQVHRVDLAAAVRAVMRPQRHIQFVHNPHGAGAGVTGAGSDSFWRFAPPVYRWIEARGLATAERIVVFSSSEAQRLLSMGYEAAAWRTWFDPSVFFPAVKRTTDVMKIVSVGRLERQKDPILAVDTVIELRRRGIATKATFVGDGSMASVLRERAESSGYGRDIEFVGNTDRLAVATALHESDVMLLASHYEGSPRVVIEALATGTPVAATSSADPDGLVARGVTGATARSRTPEALADAVITAAACDGKNCAAAVRMLRADYAVPRLWRETAIEK